MLEKGVLTDPETQLKKYTPIESRGCQTETFDKNFNNSNTQTDPSPLRALSEKSIQTELDSNTILNRMANEIPNIQVKLSIILNNFNFV